MLARLGSDTARDRRAKSGRTCLTRHSTAHPYQTQTVPGPAMAHLSPLVASAPKTKISNQTMAIMRLRLRAGSRRVVATEGNPHARVRRLIELFYRDYLICLAEYDKGEDVRALPMCWDVFRRACVDPAAAFCRDQIVRLCLRRKI